MQSPATTDLKKAAVDQTPLTTEAARALVASFPANVDPADPFRRPFTYRLHPAYMARENLGFKETSIVGHEGCWGARWKHGPFRMERYTGDELPRPPRDGKRRLMIWQPLTRQPRPKGWWWGMPGMSTGMTGYAPTVPDEPHDRYWSQHARRHNRKWQQSGWHIRDVSVEEYLDAYGRSQRQDAVLRMMFAKSLPSKFRCHPGHVRITGAAPTPTAPIQAGFVCVDVPETQESLHAFSFHCKPSADADAGTGLMDHWFRTGRERGVRWFDFGIFWRQGDPTSWHGFSRFKASFGTILVEYPTPFMRLYDGR